MDSARVELSPDETVLLESVRARITVAPVSLLGIVLPAILIVPVLVGEGVSWFRIGLFILPVLTGMAMRAIYSRRISGEIGRLSASELQSVDSWLRVSSVINQTLVGLGIWIVQSPTSDTLLLSLFVTLVQVVYLLAVMTNLFSDFRSFAFSAPPLVGLSALYWLLQGSVGLAVGVSLLIASSMMFVLQKRASQIFRESVLMRFEKDKLLEAVEAEKARTEEALQEVQEANASKAFFMAAASHDIKQPLFALGMLTDTLLMRPQSEQTESILQKQRRNISKMNFMFDDLMDLSRFEQGVFKLDIADIMTTDLIQTLDDEFSPQCEEKRLEWILRMEEVRVHTDPHLLLRLCRNLLNNALRYTDEGQICCETQVDGNHLVFEISDTGMGIAPGDQEKIFGQFVRLKEGTSDGAGLGLAIVMHIVGALGYELNMDSEPGQGTVFRFGVPLAEPWQS